MFSTFHSIVFFTVARLNQFNDNDTISVIINTWTTKNNEVMQIICFHIKINIFIILLKSFFKERNSKKNQKRAESIFCFSVVYLAQHYSCIHKKSFIWCAQNVSKTCSSSMVNLLMCALENKNPAIISHWNISNAIFAQNHNVISFLFFHWCWVFLSKICVFYFP